MKAPYNYYISKVENYNSEIAFINIKTPIIIKELYFINSKNENYLKSGFYLDNEKQELKKIYNQLRIDNFSDKYVESVNYFVRYYSYIKVIKDKNNPQLENENMIFSFGYTIYNKICKYVLRNNKFKHSFNLKVNNIYHSHDYSLFTCNFYEISEDLDIESQVKFKVYNRLKLDRRRKLDNISNDYLL